MLPPNTEVIPPPAIKTMADFALSLMVLCTPETNLYERVSVPSVFRAQRENSSKSRMRVRRLFWDTHRMSFDARILGLWSDCTTYWVCSVFRKDAPLSPLCSLFAVISMSTVMLHRHMRCSLQRSDFSIRSRIIRLMQCLLQRSTLSTHIINF